MAELVWAIICGVLAITFSIISIAQFREKGFLFNNAYIWTSKQERETMNKKPYYRQSGIAFAICAVLFFFMALECILFTGWLWFLVLLLAVALLVYAIASTKKEPLCK